VQGDLGLVVQQELPFLERRAQPVFHADAPGELGIHLDAVMQIAFARGLRFLEGGFRILHQLVRLVSVRPDSRLPHS